MEENQKKTLFSGIQPTGRLTIGNYLGALSNWVKLQDEYNCIFCIVDQHSITVNQVPAELRQKTMNLLALYLAAGVDPDKNVIFIQSHVPAHAELTWVLLCNTYIGELNRMTQFKQKSQQHAANINAGLMDYPVLMASDILLYQTDLVPVGQDQKQHLELSRDLAERFNNKYSPTFVVPEPYIAKVGSKIMSLQNPTVKMSKSDENEKATIFLDDDKDTIIKKFKAAVTDSDNRIVFSADKPAISNLLTIYSAFSGVSIKDAEKEFDGVGYGDFKLRVADAVIAKLEPIQKKQQEFLKDKDYLNSILIKGAQTANYLANKTLSKVYRKVGFVQLDK